MNCSGSGPDRSERTTFPELVSSTSMRSSSLAQTNSSLPSFDTVMPRGRRPTFQVPVTAIVAVSMTLTELPFSLVM